MGKDFERTQPVNRFKGHLPKSVFVPQLTAAGRASAKA